MEGWNIAIINLCSKARIQVKLVKFTVRRQSSKCEGLNFFILISKTVSFDVFSNTRRQLLENLIYFRKSPWFVTRHKKNQDDKDDTALPCAKLCFLWTLVDTYMKPNQK